MAKIESLRKRVWDKSQGICCLCGLQMFPDYTYGKDLAFTIEHLIPRSKGGSNEIENLDGSHGWCNNYKEDAFMEELPSGYRKLLRWKIKHLIINLPVNRKASPALVTENIV